jgi:very-short-patch-repair endonuclease
MRNLADLSAEGWNQNLPVGQNVANLAAAIRKANLPGVNVWIHNHEVDFFWREQRLIVELDSREFHLTPAAFENDRRRDIALQALGYTVIRITHRRLIEEPAAVIRELRYFLSGGGGGPCEP